MNFTFYSKTDYLTQLAQDIDHAKPGERVLVATMDFNSGEPLIAEVLESLLRAAERGVKASLLVDARSFLTVDNSLKPGPLWWHPTLGQPFEGRYKTTMDWVARLNEAGCRTVVTNVPDRAFRFPSASRSHIKAGIIADKLYLGGCNLNHQEYFDVMVAQHNKEAADWVYEQLQLVLDAKSTQQAFQYKDRSATIGNDTSVLIDSGKPKQSIILDAAHTLIDEAQEWLYITCQYFPGGATAKRLVAAERRGVKVTIRFSHPSVHGQEFPLHVLHQLYERTRVPAHFFAGRLAKGMPKLHAKVLCSEKEAIVGSHNFVSQGVTWGTAEIALHVKNQDFARGLREFMEAQINRQ
ncbi:MAG TPA: phospholipase D-like domain-containing protein [Candidatus Saccharimonadales bacterium]|nr:phospholipase D-like domain-containing protein [Candidatus Saccharimonadales bacterium]